MYKKSFRQTFYVILLSLIAAYVGRMINTIVAGQFFGATAIAAIGLASPFLNLIETFGASIAAGVQAMCGTNLGSGRIKTANGYLLASFIIATIVSIIVLLCTQLNPEAFVYLLVDEDVSPDMYNSLIEYVRGSALGVPFVMFVTILIPVMQMDSDNSKGYLSIALLLITNIVANLFVVLFIEGSYLFELALATNFAYLLNLLFLLTHFFRKNNLFKLGLYKQKLKYYKNIGINSLPAFLNRLSTTFRKGSVNWAVGKYAQELGIIANSVYVNFGDVLSSFPKAFGQTILMTCCIVGSEKDRQSIKYVFKTGLIHGVLITIVVSILSILLSQFIISIYIPPDHFAFADAKNALNFYSASLIFYSINAMFINFYQSIGKIKYSALLNIFDNFFFITLFTWLLPLKFGIQGAWIAIFLGKICTTVVIYLVACAVNKKIIPSLEDLMLLPQSFYDNESKMSVFNIETLKDSAKTSRKIKEFCILHGVEKNKAMWSALAVEEILNNTIKHGMKKNYNTVEVKLSVESTYVHILIKDNCEYFDPIEWSKLADDNNPIKSIGIKMVRDSAKSFKYERLINLNFLQIDY